MWQFPIRFPGSFKVVHDCTVSFDDVLIFNSDNVAYVKVFSSTLSVIFPNCVHITCHSHIVNLIVTDFKKNFPKVTEFFKCSETSSMYKVVEKADF